MAAGNLAVDPVMQLGTIGMLGVGAQRVAWPLRVPAIVLMLGIGLLAVTVVLHVFTLAPVARALGLSGGEAPGAVIVGGTSLGTQLGALLRDLDVPVVISDTNHRNLRSARDLGVPVFYGDLLSEAAENMLELHSYDYVSALSENEAYKTLVTTDFAPEFGRNNIFQLRRDREYSSRHELPSTLRGGRFCGKKPIPVASKSCWIGGWVSHGSARNIH